MRRGIKGEGQTPCANAYDYDGADELEQAQRDHKTASAAHDEMVLAGREMSEVRDLPREIRFQWDFTLLLKRSIRRIARRGSIYKEFYQLEAWWPKHGRVGDVAIEVVRHAGRAREMHHTIRTGRLRDQTLILRNR